MPPSGLYSGRLECDGDGNLLASEGEHAGFPVAYHDGSYIFVAPGELSHNKRHEDNVLEVVVTQDQDEDSPGFAGTPDNPVEGHDHHWGATPDDPHYAEGQPFDTQVTVDPDAVAAKVTGHTEAYTNG